MLLKRSVARAVALLWAIVVVGTAVPALAAGTTAPLPAAEGRVVLEVTGAISVLNAEGAARFDLALLESLPQQRIETYTDWTEGSQVFEGPLLADLLAAVGARGETLHAVALNDYAVDIPASDAGEYRVMLAIRHNGKPMSVREKGPIWVIYPSASHDVAKVNLNNAKSIWQLKAIEVR